MPQPSILTGMLIALLPALLPLLMFLGLLQTPASLGQTSDLLSGALLLMSALQLMRFLERRELLLLLYSLLAFCIPTLLLATSWLDRSDAMRVTLQGVLLSALLVLALYPRTQRRPAPHTAPAPPPPEVSPASVQPAPAPVAVDSSPSESDFLIRLSHEMRTPLSGVLGMTELLATTPLSPRQRDYLQTLQGAGNDLLQRINELFDISVLAEGRLELELETFDLRGLLKACIDNFHTTSGHARELLTLSLPDDLPQSGQGDPDRLRQILHHLLLNAHRRCGRQGRIGIAIQRLPREEGLCIDVCDNGRPLADEELAELLDTPFTQDNYLRARLEQREAGLLLCQRLVTLMQGRFSLDSPQDQGLCVRIQLPVTLVGEQDNPLQLSDARVLVVDACPESRAPLLELCRSWGMQAREASCAAEALGMLRSQNQMESPYDVLLIDQELPDNALELARRIRDDSWLPQDMLLILCGNGPGNLAARRAGFNRVLGRPVASYSLRATLDEELARLFAARRQSSSRTPRMQLPGSCRILVAEDDRISAQVIQGLLGRLGVHPELVRNGREALLAMQHRSFDLVLMDCDMPEMDGLTATRLQREREREKRLPHQRIVALSAHVLDTQREQMVAAGMDGLLAKPVELMQLYQVIEEQLRSTRSRLSD